MANGNFAGSARIWYEPDDVERILARLGLLPGAVFREAVRQGDLERRMTTTDDVDMASGFYFYTRALRTLRHTARNEHGWHNGTLLRIPVTFNNDETIAITVSAGDERTGRLGTDPSTKNVKGDDTADISGANKLPFGRDLDDEEHGVDFWYLLVDTSGDGLWAEVSMPVAVDHDGFVTRWHERIILGRIDDGMPSKPASPIPQPAKGDPYDVNVSRRRTA